MEATSDYLDLPINLDAMPDQSDEGFAPIDESDPMQFAGKFIQRLQQLLSSGTTDDLYKFYEHGYHKARQGLFAESKWPEPHEIEQTFDIEVNLSTQAIYNELIFRQEIRTYKPEDDLSPLAEKAWENSLGILDNIALKEKMNLPAEWVWVQNAAIQDIIDEFVYQLVLVSRWKTAHREQPVDADLWSVQKVEEVLQNLYASLTEGDKLELAEEAYTRVLFGYYALIGHFRVAVLLGRYQQALELISMISLEHTVFFSKAFGSQMSLFYNASFCYFMQEKYLEAAKLAQTIAIFYDKYKKFVVKTLSEKSLAKLNDKVLALWCIAHVFEGNEPLDAITDLVKDLSIKTKERNYSEPLEDKLEKLRQFDESTLVELFGFAAPKRITSEGLVLIHVMQEAQHDLKQLRERLENYVKLNFNAMLKLYTRIELAKAARFLHLSQKDLLIRIEDYGKRKISLAEDKVWDKSILKPLLRVDGCDNVVVTDGIINIQRESERKNNRDYANLMSAVGEISQKLRKL